MNEMEASCSFKFIVGSACSYDRRDRSKLFEVVPLVSCNKDVQGHKSAWCFAGVKSESELNLARAGIFFRPDLSRNRESCTGSGRHNRYERRFGFCDFTVQT